VGNQIDTSRPLYVERVNAVIDYVEQHLCEELTLEQLAAVAHFSPFHFHRVFTVLAGETLGRFINRLRLERAASLLIQHPQRSVTDVAVACGLPNPSTFARSFREAFGMSATDWRKGGYLDYEARPGESTRDIIGNLGVLKDGYGVTAASYDPHTGRQSWTISCGDLGPATVAIEEIPDLEVAYVRHTGRYQGLGEVFADIFGRLTTWAAPRRLLGVDSLILAVYHDNPSITAADRLRVSACITVPPETPPDGEVGRMSIAGGTYAVARFELGEKDYGIAWFALAGGWLPDSGFEPDDRLHFERYPVAAATAPERQVVDICLPVRPLRYY
jgi:AraC family transcriptional regulator